MDKRRILFTACKLKIKSHFINISIMNNKITVDNDVLTRVIYRLIIPKFITL